MGSTHKEPKYLTARVYKTGFATNKKAYEETLYPLFDSLDRLEKILDGKRYLIGDTLTEAGNSESPNNL